MALYLGLDTSNYTTSAAVYDSEGSKVSQSKKLLPVKEGELGLRQSEAVFHHVRQLPEVMEGLDYSKGSGLMAVGVSDRPRNQEGSYMPCFLAGEAAASAVSVFNRIPLYKTSHQVGHILAALYSCGRMDLVFADKPFLAFHVSGGTTDCLLAVPDRDEIIKITQISSSLDLKAGQLIDRVGLTLGLKFPCGKELEGLAMRSGAVYKIKPRLKDGNCCLSGVENKCRDMLKNSFDSCDIALYALKYIESAISCMTAYAIKKYGISDMPVVYAGGVMSDKLIRSSLSKDFNAYFSEPEFSCDNAAGIAIYAALKDGGFN